MRRGFLALAALAATVCLAKDADDHSSLLDWLKKDKVPESTDVDKADASKLSDCIHKCASGNPDGIVAVFHGCKWSAEDHHDEHDKDDKWGSEDHEDKGSDDHERDNKSASKDSSSHECVVDRDCFRHCVAPAPPPPDRSCAVLTNRYTKERTNFVVDATLTPEKVSNTNFGISNTFDVDGSVYAQPLYVPNVKLGKGKVVNLLIVATEFNSVYGFDADTGDKIWQQRLTIGRVVESIDIPGVAPNGTLNFNQPCNDIAPYYGITATPVVDIETYTVYTTSYSVEGPNAYTDAQYRFNALDIRTGRHQKNSPTEPLKASRTFPNAPLGPGNDTSVFRAIKQHQRPGLALYKGTLYVAFGSHCDRPPYFPWLFAVDPKSLAVKSFWTSPPFISRTTTIPGGVVGGGATIWQGGTGPSFIGDSIYIVTGRGPVRPEQGGYGNSIIKFSLDLNTVEDFFAPANAVFLDDVDKDLGSSGAIVIKDGKFIVTGGKQGPLYLAKADNLGKFEPNAQPPNSNVYEVIRSVPLNDSGRNPSIYSGPAYWGADTGSIVFRARYTDPNGKATLYRYQFDANDKLPQAPTAQATEKVGVFAARASNPVIQAAAKDAKDAIVWESDEQSSLFGWRYSDLSLLFSSNNTQICGGTKSSAGGVVKFAAPTIACGSLYLGCGNRVLQYQLRH